MKVVPYLVAGLAQATPAAADTDPITFAAGASFVVPIGAWGDGSGVGFGAQLDARYALSPRLAAVARLQPVFHLESRGEKTREIALLVGMQASLSPQIAITFGAGASYWSFRSLYENEDEIGIAGSLAVEVAVHPRATLGAGIFSPDFVRGGMTNLETGAHGSEKMIGVAGSASVSF